MLLLNRRHAQERGEKLLHDLRIATLAQHSVWDRKAGRQLASLEAALRKLIERPRERPSARQLADAYRAWGVDTPD